MRVVLMQRVILVGAISLAAVACGGDSVDGEDTNTFTTSGVSVTTGDSEWDAVTVFVSPEGPQGLPPDDYRTGRFAVPFQFHLTDGWTSFLQERSNAVTLASLNPDTNVEFQLFDRGTALETLQSFESPEIEVSEAAEVIVGGAVGYASVVTATEQATLFSDLIDGAYSVQPGTAVMVWAVDVNGTTVTIIQQAQDEADLATSSTLINSVAWKASVNG